MLTTTSTLSRTHALPHARTHSPTHPTSCTQGREIPRFGHRGSVANAAGYCFESIWHHILGEPLYGYTPPFRVLDDLPRVAFHERCAEAMDRETCANRNGQ